MSQTMNQWTKRFTKTIDQRDRQLPPLWTSRQTTEVSSGELDLQSGIHRSGRHRELARHIMQQIDSAEKVVIISSFLMADKEIEKSIHKAVKRRVRVYLMLASENKLKEPPEDSDYDKMIYKEHADMLNRLAGWVFLRSAENIHAKVVLIDPISSKPSGTLLTANLTKEALERNEELALTLSINQISEVYSFLRWAIWEKAEHELLEVNRLNDVIPLGEIDPPRNLNHISVTCEHLQTIRKDILNIVNSTSSELIVSSFGWEQDHEVVKAICQRARIGVNVMILARVRPSAMPALLELRRAGARVLGFKWLHAKAIWSDAGEGMIMTSNLESHGMDDGFEIGISIRGNALDSLGVRLLEWIDAAPWELQIDRKLSELNDEVLIWKGKQFVSGHVKEKEEISLGQVIAPSLEQFHSTVPVFPSEKEITGLAHELLYYCEVIAPVLAKESTQQYQPIETGKTKPVPYQPPVYKERNGRLVIAIRKAEEMERAIKLKAELKADVDVKSIVLYEEP